MKAHTLLATACTWLIAFWLKGADTTPPTVQSLTPPAGAAVSTLSQVQVTFSEPVAGVEAQALRIQGSPAAQVNGGGAQWTFRFAEPFPGSISLRWALDHTITDLAGNSLDPESAGTSWTYELKDALPPQMATVLPTPGSRVGRLETLSIVFSEPVTGVDPSDLRVNGQPAVSVTGSDVGPYVFRVNAPTSGTVSVEWAPDVGITDLAIPPNPFVGGTWTYERVTPEATGDVVINEILADNGSGLADEDGETQDWIELWNRGTQPVPLLGWSLSDDPATPDAWMFPDVTLPANGYLVVFASGKNRRSAKSGTRLHTAFRLGGDGEFLALYDASAPRRVVHSFQGGYPGQRRDIAWGLTPQGIYSYLGTPTPGQPNGPGAVFSGVVGSPSASVQSGFFREPFQVDLSSSTPGARIYYTLDGSVPTEAGLRYRGTLGVTGTVDRAVVTLRAAAFRAGMLPSTVTTHTYLFREFVPSQPAKPAGFPTTWLTLNNPEASASTSGDYEMDPRVVTNGNNRALILQGLASLPTVSIVTDTSQLFGNNGVYSRRQDTNQQPVHVEMMNTNGQVLFRQDAGLEIQGGSSTTDAGGDWKSKNLSLRLLFRGDFGPGRLAAEVFPGSPVQEFDTLVLDAGLNMVWNHMTDADQRNRGQYAREQFINEMMLQSGILAPRGRYVHLYLNGLYWGMKVLHERPDASWAANHLGGDRAEYDVFKHEGTASGLQEGTLANYNSMLQLARANLASNTNYEKLQLQLDVDWLIDYMLVNFWGGNTDWDNHNWYAVRRRTPGAPGWRYISWDAEHVLKGATDNVISVNNAAAPSELLQSLMKNAEFRLRFADHVHRHFFNGGIFFTLENRNWDPGHPEWNRPAAEYMKIIRQIDPAIVAESARWGDVARPGNPYTRDGEWLRELQSLLFNTNSPGNTTRYFPTRSSNVLASLKSARLYPSGAVAPSLSRLAGAVPFAQPLTLSIGTNAGVIHFTTNGTDPRIYGSGAASPSARVFTDGSPILLTASLTIKARTLNGTNWSALVEASFSVDATQTPVRFTEIMYHPPGGDAHEFVEISNLGAIEADLSLATIGGIGFTFPAGSRLPPGGVWVLCSGIDTNSWQLRYPGVPIRGVFPGSLSNSGERLELRGSDGVLLTAVSYADKSGWPEQADGAGASLELIAPDRSPDDPAAWMASPVPGGSPGLRSAVPSAPSLRISEVAAAGDAVSPDFIELENTTDASLQLTGWSLTDARTTRRFVFPQGTSVQPRGRIVVAADSVSGAGLHTGFGLDREGDAVFLHDPAGTRVDALSFGNQIPGFSLSRIGAAWMLGLRTPGDENTAAPVAGQDSIRINEWLANSTPGADDWIEIYNLSPSLPLALEGLFISNGERSAPILYPTFIAPLGFLSLQADENPGARHIGLKFSGAGGILALRTAGGVILDSVTFDAAQPGVSQGRLPDGAAPPFQNFTGTPSPGASNYLADVLVPQISEVMASNNTRPAGDGIAGFPDWVELHNPGATEASLAGYTLVRSRGGDRSTFAFPPDTVLGAGQYRIVTCDAGLSPSTSAAGTLNSGFALPSTGCTLTLANPQGRITSSITFGLQVTDLSIGVSGDRTWTLLRSPTPGGANAPAAALGSSAEVRVNEWMAAPEQGSDWIELFNRDPLPVDLSGMQVADDPSPSSPGLTVLPGLSFIAGRGRAVLIADGDSWSGPNHVRFNLNASGESIILRDAAGGWVDGVSFGETRTAESGGRLPDGGPTITRFPNSASPGDPNFIPLDSVVINEVLSRGPSPAQDFVELLNRSDTSVNIGGWFISDREEDLLRFRIPDGISLAPGEYRIFTGGDLGSGLPASGFLIDSANSPAAENDEFSTGDELHLSEAGPGGVLTGRRDTVRFGATFAGQALGRLESSFHAPMVPVSSPTPGAANRPVDPGPLVFNEIRAGEASPGLDYIEILNSAFSGMLIEGTPGMPHWRIRGDVDFDFPGGNLFSSRAHVLVVGFDPVADTAAAATFRDRYALKASDVLLGPWSGKLGGLGADLRLERLAGSQAAGRPDAGAPVYVVVDAVTVSSLPAPGPAEGDPYPSLQRWLPTTWGQTPSNWRLASPTPDRANRPDSTPADSDGDGLPDTFELLSGLGVQNPFDSNEDPDGDGRSTWHEYLLGTNPFSASSAVVSPVISSAPGDQTVPAGATASFTVGVTGSEPLSFQWAFEGYPIPGATSSTLRIGDAQADLQGAYEVSIFNAAGETRSKPARLVVIEPPDILLQPASLAVNPGSNVTLRVVAFTSHPPLRYQWFFNGREIPDATADELALQNVQLPQEGNYFLRVGDTVGETLSVTVRLSVKVKPVILSQPSPAQLLVAAGDTASFSVSASGSLPMTFRWRRNLGAIYTNITLFSNTCVFTLRNVTTNLAGSWSVSVTNSGGASSPLYSSNAVLAVQIRPSIVVQPQDQLVEPGAPATLTATATGTGPLAYRWFLDGVPLPGGASPTLLLPSIDSSQQGGYFVIVSNAVGTATSRTARVSLNLPRVVASRVADGVVTLDWTASAGRSYRVQYTPRLNEVPWVDLPGDIVAAGPTASRTDTLPPGTRVRYYRITLLP